MSALRARISKRLPSIRGDLHPIPVAVALIASIAAALANADIVSAVLVAIVNVIYCNALSARTPSLREYALIAVPFVWAGGVRAGISCMDLPQLMMCARYPGPGLCAACVATASVITLVPGVHQDRVARLALRAGLRWQLLATVFVVSPLARVLIDSGAQSRLLMPQANDPTSLRRRIRMKCKIASSTFVRILTQHWLAHDATETRLPASRIAPVFIQSDPLRSRDRLLLTQPAALVFATWILAC